MVTGRPTSISSAATKASILSSTFVHEITGKLASAEMNATRDSTDASESRVVSTTLNEASILVIRRSKKTTCSVRLDAARRARSWGFEAAWAHHQGGSGREPDRRKRPSRFLSALPYTRNNL